MWLAPDCLAASHELRLATTTSTQDSGLLAAILPKFERASGLRVKVTAVGTGRALLLGEHGDVDAVLVHSRPDEDRFVAAGHGIERRDVMHNDFVLVGPAQDPAQVRGAGDVAEALRRIAKSRSPFVTRGDDSGTHKMETRLWEVAGVGPDLRRYALATRGMGDALKRASDISGYTLSDRATYAAYRSRLRLETVLEGDPRLTNPYGVIAVNPARHSHVDFDAAMQLIRWLTGPQGRRAISEFRVNGQQLFFPAHQ